MAEQPNVIVFMTDDQGYGDLSCMGATDFKTPNLDRMAGEGARFTDWYANSAVCSPSRASLITGKYPPKAGVRAVLGGHRTASGCPGSIPSIPSVLAQKGYRSYLSGKWHLGLSEECRPHNHGFDHWYGFLAGCVDYYSHIFYWGLPKVNPTHDLWEDNEEIWENGKYFTEAITEKAIDYIRDANDAGQPFFLFVSYNAPHYPMHAPQKYMDRFKDLPWDRQVMAAMLSAVDDGVGEILDEVERRGLRENTLSFFMSDNGPSRESRNWLDGSFDPYYGGSQGALKGHKFSLFEGGIREPAIMHWPGNIPANQVLTAPCAGTDILPTVAEAAGVDISNEEIDGRSILEYVKTGEPGDLTDRTLFWELNNQTAIRQGPWKLVLNGQLVEHEEPVAETHLANLDENMSESENLADQYPERTAKLKRQAEEWREEIEERWQREFGEKKQGTTSSRT